ncbi:hypothetical protein J2T13_004497 [Paenibacillus sp. DS2015]
MMIRRKKDGTCKRKRDELILTYVAEIIELKLVKNKYSK